MLKLSGLITSIFIFFNGFAQYDIGLFGGLSNYQGDLVAKAYKSSRGAFGISVGYEVTSQITVRAGLSFASVAGADSLNTTSSLRYRNLSFQSPITEFSVIGEFYTFDFDNKRWSPYVFAGLAVFHFNPYAYDPSNRKVYLRPLSTEGEGLPGYPDSKSYALTSLALPFGAGIKYAVNDNIRVGLSVGLRKTFTDHLDDVSGNYADAADLLAAKGQEAVTMAYRGGEVVGGNPVYPAKGAQRGNPKSKDYYYFTGLEITFRLHPNSNNNSGQQGGKKGYGCPTSPL